MSFILAVQTYWCQQCNFCLPAEKVINSSTTDEDLSRVHLIS